MKLVLPVLLLFIVLVACTRKIGTNPMLAYSDKALLDSCRAPSRHYYKNNSIALLSGAAGSNAQHGPFLLRFNTVAFKTLTDSGRLPLKASMPEGSLVIKDVYSGGNLATYAVMYKYAGAWLWAELAPNGQVLYSVSKNPGVCTGCHSGAGNRDLLRTFTFY